MGLGETALGTRLVWRMSARLRTLGSRLKLTEGELVVDRTLPPDSRRVEPVVDTLLAFVELEGTSDETVFAFARRWGLLELCPAGLPRSHSVTELPSGVSPALSLAGAWTCSNALDSAEPIRFWRYWVGQAAALARLGAELRAERQGRREDWEAIRAAGPWAVGPHWDGIRESLEENFADRESDADGNIWVLRGEIAHALDTWFRLAGVRHEVTWLGDYPRVELRATGLFAALGVILASLIGDTGGFAVCGGCGATFVPGRRLGPNDRSRYCEQCRSSGIPRRVASRAYYRRRAAQPEYLALEALRKRTSRASARP